MEVEVDKEELYKDQLQGEMNEGRANKRIKVEKIIINFNIF